MIKTCVIPAAGKGERLKEISKGKSKEMLVLRGKRLIDHALDECTQAGIKNIIVVSNSLKQDLNSYLATKAVTIVYQQSLAGLADAVYTAREYISEPNFLVILPDVIASPTYSLELIQAFDRKQKNLVAYREIPGVKCPLYGILRGYPQGDRSIILRRIVEKPHAIDTNIGFGAIGRYVLPKTLLNLIPVQDANVDNELQLSDSINDYIKKYPQSFLGYELPGMTLDAGNPQAYS